VIFRTGGGDDILPGRVPPALLALALRRRRLGAGFAADRSAIYGGFHLYRHADEPCSDRPPATRP
jgi:S-adenosylmethionine-diacylglycerol 3-amino-3-carboxypropyl transferase